MSAADRDYLKMSSCTVDTWLVCSHCKLKLLLLFLSIGDSNLGFGSLRILWLTSLYLWCFLVQFRMKSEIAKLSKHRKSLLGMLARNEDFSYPLIQDKNSTSSSDHDGSATSRLIDEDRFQSVMNRCAEVSVVYKEARTAENWYVVGGSKSLLRLP